MKLAIFWWKSTNFNQFDLYNERNNQFYWHDELDPSSEMSKPINFWFWFDLFPYTKGIEFNHQCLSKYISRVGLLVKLIFFKIFWIIDYKVNIQNKQILSGWLRKLGFWQLQKGKCWRIYAKTVSCFYRTPKCIFKFLFQIHLTDSALMTEWSTHYEELEI